LTFTLDKSKMFAYFDFILASTEGFAWVQENIIFLNKNYFENTKIKIEVHTKAIFPKC
jgi:hypothetical protein